MAVQLDRESWAVLEHLAQMSEQTETGDVCAGVNALADRLDLPKQRVLAASHAFERSIQISSLGGATHGPCKQHSSAKGSTDQKRITRT